MKRKIDFTDGKKQLIAGMGYIVLYRDYESGEERMAIATWDGESFKYPDGRFMDGTAPQIRETVIPRLNRVMGFFKAADYRG